MKRSTWNTYDVTNDQRSAGGVDLHQVRRAKAGWQTRICQSNGRHRACGPVRPISDVEGEGRYFEAWLRLQAAQA